MPAHPKKAFVLAAGMGSRMRPLTDNCPKPLLVVDGKSMLDRALDALAETGVEDVVVNTHYLGEMIAAHLRLCKHPRITISPEPELLDTAGGVKKNLAFFGNDPFYVLNADVLWTNGRTPTLQAMADKWDDATMDVLILLHEAADVPAYAGHGDYHLAEGSDRPVFAKGTGQKANYIFAGPRIAHPRLFDDTPDGKFGFLQLFHKAEKAGRLAALRHDGEWHHVGTPEAFAETNLIFAKKKAV
ncbi:MAG: nucleotidyltransferase family protein [Alphaproteobacteria bacterium]|nr:nucleotidyltransferase family protein [Alphaproteobacteria bacterium]